MKRFILIPILILTGSLLLAACASAQKAPSPSTVAITTVAITGSTVLSRTDSLGAVTVKITPLNLDQPGDALKFDVAMDTHSVDLSMDLAALATLKTDTGFTLQSMLWDGPKGGHHVEGTLSFQARQGGKSILDGTKQLTLTISNVDNATSTFIWDLNAK